MNLDHLLKMLLKIHHFMDNLFKLNVYILLIQLYPFYNIYIYNTINLNLHIYHLLKLMLNNSQKL